MNRKNSYPESEVASTDCGERIMAQMLKQCRMTLTDGRGCRYKAKSDGLCGHHKKQMRNVVRIIELAKTSTAILSGAAALLKLIEAVIGEWSNYLHIQLPTLPPEVQKSSAWRALALDHMRLSEAIHAHSAGTMSDKRLRQTFRCAGETLTRYMHSR
jgi:hypothetical protein